MSDIREPTGILPYSPENYPETIPDFKSDEEARDFWDTHDSSYYWDQMEVVFDSRNEPPRFHERKPSNARKRPEREPMMLLSIRYPEQLIDRMKVIAERRHLPYQTLLRSWVADRLEQEEAADLAESVERKAS